jgi:hypothetical protein
VPCKHGFLKAHVTAFIPVAHAGSTVTEPSDCSLTVPYHMTCTARPTGQQWQEVIYCNPGGVNGTDYFDYGTIVTGDGTSIAACALRNDEGYAEVSFSDAGLQKPGKQF